MDKDRTEICNIISEMLDNPDKHGIFPTSTAYTRLEHLIERARIEAPVRQPFAAIFQIVLNRQ